MNARPARLAPPTADRPAMPDDLRAAVDALPLPKLAAFVALLDRVIEHLDDNPIAPGELEAIAARAEQEAAR